MTKEIIKEMYKDKTFLIILRENFGHYKGDNLYISNIYVLDLYKLYKGDFEAKKEDLNKRIIRLIQRYNHKDVYNEKGLKDWAKIELIEKIKRLK